METPRLSRKELLFLSPPRLLSPPTLRLPPLPSFSHLGVLGTSSLILLCLRCFFLKYHHDYSPLSTVYELSESINDTSNNTIVTSTAGQSPLLPTPDCFNPQRNGRYSHCYLVSDDRAPSEICLASLVPAPSSLLRCFYCPLYLPPTPDIIRLYPTFTPVDHGPSTTASALHQLQEHNSHSAESKSESIEVANGVHTNSQCQCDQGTAEQLQSSVAPPLVDAKLTW